MLLVSVLLRMKWVNVGFHNVLYTVALVHHNMGNLWNANLVGLTSTHILLLNTNIVKRTTLHRHEEEWSPLRLIIECWFSLSDYSVWIWKYGYSVFTFERRFHNFWCHRTLKMWSNPYIYSDIFQYTQTLGCKLNMYSIYFMVSLTGKLIGWHCNVLGS